MVLEQFSQELKNITKTKLLLRDIHKFDKNFCSTTELAARINFKSAYQLHLFLQNLGVIEKYAIEFKRPLEQVKHKNRHGWRICDEHREALIETGLASETGGPYRHDIK